LWNESFFSAPQLKRDPLGRGNDLMSNRVIRIIAWWEIVCGTLGIAMSGALYLGIFANSAAMLGFVGPMNYWGGIAFFAFVIVAGRALLRQQAWGLKASIVCQTLQVASFAFLNGPHVQIQAGPRLGINVTSDFVGFTAGFSSSFFLGIRAAGPAYDVTVNVLAAVWVVFLVREWLRINQVTSPAAA